MRVKTQALIMPDYDYNGESYHAQEMERKTVRGITYTEVWLLFVFLPNT